MDESQEPAATSFSVYFLTVDGRQLTVIGPPDAIEALEARLKDVSDVELHRSAPRDHPTD
jgi:hypothetical protein